MDATGDVNGLIRASDNAVVAQYAYTPWGELEIDSTNIGNSLRWKGLVYDRETGLYYVRARYCDPTVRRFISEDPIGLEGGINVFAFASGDPMNRSDPTGLDDCKWVNYPGAYVTTYDVYNGNHSVWTDPPRMDYECKEQTAHRYEDPAARGGPATSQTTGGGAGIPGHQGPDPKPPGENLQTHRTGPREISIFYTAVNHPLELISKTTSQGRMVMRLEPGTALFYRGVLFREDGSRWGMQGKLLEATRWASRSVSDSLRLDQKTHFRRGLANQVRWKRTHLIQRLMQQRPDISAEYAFELPLAWPEGATARQAYEEQITQYARLMTSLLASSQGENRQTLLTVLAPFVREVERLWRDTHLPLDVMALVKEVRTP